MPAERRFGMDHPHYQWSPIVNRGKLRWPNDARVALCVVVNLEHMEWTDPEDSFTHLLAGGMGSRGTPDFARTSHREYGHRVGIFRVLDTLESHGIKATMAMDAVPAENYPFCTVDPNVGVVPHPEPRLEKITTFFRPEKIC